MARESDSRANLDEIYRDIILEHHQDPRNFGELDHPDVSCEGYNPLCGDRICLQLKLDPHHRRITDSRFTGEGCAICMASASIMTEQVEGQEVSQALASIQNFRDLMQGEKDSQDFEGDVGALAGVRKFPVRIKCALLPWTTLKDGLEKDAETGSVKR